MTPDLEQYSYSLILYCSLRTLFLVGIFVSQVSVWVLLSKGNVQFNYTFPKADGALKLEASRLDMSVPLGSQHNKFYCFFSTAVQLITPFTQHSHCFRSAIFTLVPAQVGTHCQFPTCRYNTVCKEQLSTLWTDFHLTFDTLVFFLNLLRKFKFH